MRRSDRNRLFAVFVFLFALGADATGSLKLDVMGEMGAGAKNQAEIIAPDGKIVAKVTPGATIAVPPGTYKLRLPLIGGEIVKNDIVIESGRTHTVLIADAAVLSVSVKDKDGHDPGFTVTVNQTDPPQARVATLCRGTNFYSRRRKLTSRWTRRRKVTIGTRSRFRPAIAPPSPSMRCSTPS